MTETKTKRSAVATAIKRYFVQTFRRHTGKEYSEFLSRGVQKREDRVNRQYAWVYVRLFALIFVLYAVFLLIIRFTGNELFVPSVILLAALLFNVPFLVLLYELSPDNGISLIAVFAALLIGGTCADVIVQVLYSFFSASNSWMEAVNAGFFEELSKAAVTIIIIVSTVKSRQPYFGFLVGAAVGCGFSIVEDMGYVFILSDELPAFNLTTIIEISIARGASAVCTHTVWTAMVGWAYCFFDRHRLNLAFYFTLLLSCGLHIVWDLPLKGMWYYIAVAGCVIVSAAVCIPIIARARQKVIKASPPVSEDDKFFVTDNASLDKHTPEYFAHAAHLSLSFGAVLMAVVAIIFCWIPFRDTYYTATFTDKDKFVAFMQEDYPLTADWQREYDKTLAATSVPNADGEIIKVIQVIQADGYEYAYGYTLYDDGEGGTAYSLADIEVKIRKDGVYTWVYAENLYDNAGDPTPYATYFRVRSDVTGFIFSLSGDEITVYMYDPAFERDLTAPQYTGLFCTFAGVGGVALIAFAACEIKARRIKRNVTK